MGCEQGLHASGHRRPVSKGRAQGIKERTSQGQIYAPGGNGRGGLLRWSASCDRLCTARTAARQIWLQTGCMVTVLAPMVEAARLPRVCLVIIITWHPCRHVYCSQESVHMIGWHYACDLA